MRDYSTLLAEIRDSSGDTTASDMAVKTPVIINSSRQIELPEGFDPVIAVEGDVGSQVITFQCNRYWDNRDLSACGFKRLRWANLVADTEGVSILSPTIVNDDGAKDDKGNQLQLQWLVPPDAAEKSGTIEISISIYDVVNQNGINRVGYSWNTITFSEFLIGPSLQGVGYEIVGSSDSKEGGFEPPKRLPAKDEILFIDLEKKNIVAPAGYNYTVANYGESGTGKVFFQVNRYLMGVDLSSNKADIRIWVGYEGATEPVLEGYGNVERNISFADGVNGEGLLNLAWTIPDAVTENSSKYSGEFNIAVSFYTSPSEESPSLVWRSSVFPGLTLGQSLYSAEVEPLIPKRQYLIQGAEYSEAYSDTENKVAGLVTLRSYTEGYTTDDTTEEIPLPFSMHKDELVAIYGEDGKYKGIKIGGEEGQHPNKASWVYSTEVFEDQIWNYLSNNDFVIDANINKDAD